MRRWPEGLRAPSSTGCSEARTEPRTNLNPKLTEEERRNVYDDRETDRRSEEGDEEGERRRRAPQQAGRHRIAGAALAAVPLVAEKLAGAAGPKIAEKASDAAENAKDKAQDTVKEAGKDVMPDSPPSS